MPISKNGLLESGNSSIELTNFRKVLFEFCTIQDLLPTEMLYKKKMMTRESTDDTGFSRHLWENVFASDWLRRWASKFC